jgi:mannose-6-phosphate isomerase-like protein (cupin superfamily)
MRVQYLPGPCDEAALRHWFTERGLSPYQWTNGPYDRYPVHTHSYDKYLACSRGSIVFHLDDGDVTLRAGDRMVLPAGMRHSADVGPDGVACWEAATPPRGG